MSPKNDDIDFDDNEEELKPAKPTNKPAPAKKISSADATKRILEGVGDTAKWWKPKSGNNIIRILPPTEEGKPWLYKSVLHHGIKIERKDRAMPCLQEAFGKPCPACEVIAYFSRDPDPDVTGIIKEIRPNTKYVMNVLDRREADPAPRLFTATTPVVRDIKKFIQANEDVEDITDPESGRDVVITKEGDGKQTRYSAQVKIKSSPIGLDEYEALDLEENVYTEVYDYARMCELLVSNFSDVMPDIDKAFKQLSKKVKEEKKQQRKVELEGEDAEESL